MNHLKIIRLLDVRVDELENLLLDRTQTSNLGHLGGNVALTLHSLIDELRASSVHGQHVKVDPPDLRIEVGSDRAAGCNVGLHDVADNLDDLGILQASRVLVCLSNDVVPLSDVLARRQRR